MKHWITIILALGALLCAVALAPLVREDAGYVLIEFGQWTIESNVLVLLALLLLLMITVKLLFWLLSLPRRAATNLARRRLENGLLALAEGNWQQAEKALSKAAASRAAPVAGFLAAARAADGHGDDAEASAQRQQRYLSAADDGHARTRFLIQLSKARLLINKQQHARAVTLLQHCLHQRRRHRQALRMLADCYRELGQWAALRGLLPAMRKTGLLDRHGSADLERLSINNELAAAEDAEQLQKSWDSLLRSQRQHADIIATYARQALRFDFPRLSESVLIQALEHQPDGNLAELYARAHLEPLEKAVKRAQKWQRKHPDNASIQRLLGQLYLQDKKWGKARDHLQESLRLQADSSTYSMLGQLLQQQGDSDAAANCFYNALQLQDRQAEQASKSDASVSSQRQQLANVQLRPIYTERALTDDNAVSSATVEKKHSDGRDQGAEQTPNTSETTTPAATQQVDSDGAIGDISSVPADFQPAERGAKSNES